ncbi:MAG: hypothetical protein Ct9H90mP21_2520 [Methanobacteriota archaeon]|nr:MAG: hypothetical protein Ct9H90mP21_2520 [Euryarchaeota archaeon]
MVTRTKGSRQGTRSILRKNKRERRRLFIGRTMHTYQEGEKSLLFSMGPAEGNATQALSREGREKSPVPKEGLSSSGSRTGT